MRVGRSRTFIHFQSLHPAVKGHAGLGRGTWLRPCGRRGAGRRPPHAAAASVPASAHPRGQAVLLARFVTPRLLSSLSPWLIFSFVSFGVTSGPR